MRIIRKGFVLVLCCVLSVMCMPIGVFGADSETPSAGEVNSAEGLAAALTQGGEIKLISDITLGELPTTEQQIGFTVPSGVETVLDLNGHTIDASLKTGGNNYAQVHVIFNQGDLTIQDTSAAGNGKIANTYAASNSCTRTIKNDTTGTLTINGGTIQSAGAVALLNLGVCTIAGENVVIESMRDDNNAGGGWDNAYSGIEQRGGSGSVLNVESGQISSVSRAAIFCDNHASVVNITGGTFTGNAGYGVFNGGAADQAIVVKGGRFNSDPSLYMDDTYFVVGPASGYYSVSAKASTEAVTVSSGDIAEVLKKYDALKPVKLEIAGQVTLNESATLAKGSSIIIHSQGKLTIGANATLSKEGNLENNGVIVGLGLVSNPLDIGGAGTVEALPVEGNTYTIDSASDLQWLTYVLEKTDSESLEVTLSQDIVLSENIAFQPIASGERVFVGTFDGEGHSISNLYLSTNTAQSGLFYSVADSTIKNLTLDNVQARTNTGYIGAVVADAMTGNTFENITVSGSVGADGVSYGVAGIAASVGRDGTAKDTYFINCNNKATIGGANAFNIGSVFGTASGAKEKIHVYNCTNSGAITAKGSMGYAFGYGYLNSAGMIEIIGFNNTGKVNDKDGVICNALGSGYTYTIDNADGSKFVAVHSDNGWVAKGLSEVQARINGNYFLDAAKAINAAKDGDVVKLLNGAKLVKDIIVSKEITIEDSSTDNFGKLIAGDGYVKLVDKNSCSFKINRAAPVTEETTNPDGSTTTTTTQTDTTTGVESKTEVVKGTNGQTTAKVEVSAPTKVVTTGSTAKAEVSLATADKLVEQAKAAEKTAADTGASSVASTVTIETKETNAPKIQTVLPASAIKSIAGETKAAVKLVTPVGEVVLDNEALKKIAAKAGVGEVTLAIENVTVVDLPEIIQSVVGEKAMVLDLSVETDNGKVTDFGQGSIAITVEIPKAIGTDVKVMYVKDNGEAEEVGGEVMTVDEKPHYRFTTDHFSYYALAESELVDKAVATTEDAKLKAAIEAITIEAVAKGGDGHVNLSWRKSEGQEVESYQVFRATKENGAYEQLSSVQTTSYKDTSKLGAGQTYYYKVRGTKMIDGDIVYTKWSSVVSGTPTNNDIGDLTDPGEADLTDPGEGGLTDSGEDNRKGDKGSPQTGDIAPMGMYIFLEIMALLLLGAGLKLKKKS